jgi:hypothetical protein
MHLYVIFVLFALVKIAYYANLRSKDTQKKWNTDTEIQIFNRKKENFNL